MRILFDYNRTLFDPEARALYEGVPQLLEDLSVRNDLFLVSRNEPGRASAFSALGISRYFKKTIFADDKSAELFRELCGESADVFVVGDRVREEISIGNQLGWKTVWVRQGKFAHELPSNAHEDPMFTVRDVREIKTILARYEY
jgi:FMN phosphatase YigB (HAD superfamily)